MSDPRSPVSAGTAGPAGGAERVVLRWLGWTALYAVLFFGFGYLFRAFAESGLATILTFIAAAAVAFGIGVAFAHPSWVAGPIVAGIVLPLVLVGRGVSGTNPDEQGTRDIVLFVGLLGAVMSLIPSLPLALLAWLGVRFGKRRRASQAASTAGIAPPA